MGISPLSAAYNSNSSKLYLICDLCKILLQIDAESKSLRLIVYKTPELIKSKILKGIFINDEYNIFVGGKDSWNETTSEFTCNKYKYIETDPSWCNQWYEKFFKSIELLHFNHRTSIQRLDHLKKKHLNHVQDTEI